MVSDVTSAVIDDDHMVIDEQMEVLQAVFSKEFERIHSKGEEDEYDSFPKFAYFGGGISNGRDTVDVCAFFIFDDWVLIEGVEICFLDCKVEEVQSVVRKVYQLASYAVNFLFFKDLKDRWQVVKPDYTSSEYSGC